MKTIREMAEEVELYAQLMEEWKADHETCAEVLERVRQTMGGCLDELRSIDQDPTL